jgi:hypothetical protein
MEGFLLCELIRQKDYLSHYLNFIAINTQFSI